MGVFLLYRKIENLINVDFNNRRVDTLYAAVCKLSDRPIIEQIAEKIGMLDSNDNVILTTGSVTRSWVTPRIGETDGPIGTAVLAKRIRELTGALPLIYTERSLVPSISQVLVCAGLSVVTLEQAEIAHKERRRGQTSVACVLSYSEVDDEAKKQAERILCDIHPKMIISIEKAGFNEAGIYHNMRGHDYSYGRCRIDYLVDAANIKGITTIGIGDGGNEIGMGAITDTVKDHVPYGKDCQCGCGKGIAAKIATEILLPACVSNWGCYAICAALAMKYNKPKLLHNSCDEERLIYAAITAGMVDGATGSADTTVDGFSKEANCAMVEFIKQYTLKELG